MLGPYPIDPNLDRPVVIGTPFIWRGSRYETNCFDSGVKWRSILQRADQVLREQRNHPEYDIQLQHMRAVHGRTCHPFMATDTARDQLLQENDEIATLLP